MKAKKMKEVITEIILETVFTMREYYKNKYK